MKKITKKYKLGNPTTKLEIWLDQELESANRAVLHEASRVDSWKQLADKARVTSDEQAMVDRFREAMALHMHEAAKQALAYAGDSQKICSALGLKDSSNAAVWRRINRECFRLATQYAAKG